MSNTFDPYHKWLGIPPKDQPPNHYRLLGIEPFEGDADVITGASDQRMQFLLTLQTGEHSKLVDKLLNEIANAKACLLNKEKKTAYDKRLRAKTAVEEKRQESTAKPLFKVDLKTTSRRRGKRSAPPSARKVASGTKSSPRLMPIIVLAVVALAIGGGIYFFMQRSAEQDERNQQMIARQNEETRTAPEAKEEAQRQSKAPQEQAAEVKREKQKFERKAVAATKREAERKAKEEAERKAQEEAELKKKQEAQRKKKAIAAKDAAKRADRIASSAAKTKKRADLIKQRKERKEAIAILQAKGLKRGKNGWAPQDMVEQIADLKKEVAALETGELTPEQKVQVKQLMERYYEAKFAEWRQLQQKGLASAAFKGLELGAIALPTPEFKQYQHLENHLVGPQRRGEKPNIQPSNAMQEEARFASLRVLTKQNAQYLNQANVQHKKKQKQIKTLEKKIRIRIRSLQKDIEVQQVLNKAGGKLNTTFISKK